MAPLIEMRKVTKEYRGVPAIKDVDFTLRARRDPCAARRERRRQVDADQDHGRRDRADQRRDPVRRQADGVPVAGRGAAARHHHGVPGDQPGAVDDGGAEPLPRRREILQPPARHLHRRAAVPAVAELSTSIRRRRSATLGAAKKQMVEIARAVRHNARVIIFDEPTASLTPEEKHAFLRADAAAEGARRVDHLHLACAGGGAASCRPHHHPARRRAGRDRRHVSVRPRQDHPRHGRPQPVRRALQRTARQRRGAPARRC